MDKVYAVLYSEDAFEGVSVPSNLKHVLEKIDTECGDDVIEQIIEDADTYQSTEVEYASQSREGSYGTKKLESEAEIISFFNMKFDLNIGSSVPLSKLEPSIIKGFLTESMIKAVGAHNIDIFYTSLDSLVKEFLESDDFEIEVTEPQEDEWVLYVSKGDDSKRFVINKSF